MTTLKAHVESYLAQSAKPKPLELIYKTQATWPFHAAQRSSSKQKLVHIGVLDSSFNPPQRAHFALASTVKPAFANEDRLDDKKGEFDAILLLFSVRNADKGLGTSKDASTLQRLEMMQCFANDLENEKGSNVAIGMIEEPLMISKSTLVHEYIQQSVTKSDTAAAAAEEEKAHEKKSPSELERCARLHWLVGFDTLERFFEVKYYPSPHFFDEACQKFFEEEQTTFICARRGKSSLPNRKEQKEESEKEQERNLLNSDIVAPWLARGSIVMVDLAPSVQSVSSTAVRRTIRDTTLSNEQRKAQIADSTTPSVCEYILNTNIYEAEEECKS